MSDQDPSSSRHRTWTWAMAVILLMGGSGCITSRTYQPATTVGEGIVAADGELASRWQFPPGFDLRPKIVASPAIGLAYGVTDWFDARLTLSGDLIGLQTKVALLQDREAGGFTLSLAPHLAGLHYLIGYSLTWELPILVGYRWSERTEWVLAATVKDSRSTDPIEGGVAFVSRTWGGTASVHHVLGRYVRLTAGMGAFQAVVGLALFFETPWATPPRPPQPPS